MLLLRFGQLAWTSLALAECLLLKGCWLNIDLENGQPWHKLPTIELKLGDMLSRKETHRSIPDNSGVSIRGIFWKDWQRRRLGSAKMSFQKKKQIIEWKQECPLNKGRRFTYVIGKAFTNSKANIYTYATFIYKITEFLSFYFGPKKNPLGRQGLQYLHRVKLKMSFSAKQIISADCAYFSTLKNKKAYLCKGTIASLLALNSRKVQRRNCPRCPVLFALTLAVQCRIHPFHACFDRCRFFLAFISMDRTWIDMCCCDPCCMPINFA